MARKRPAAVQPTTVIRKTVGREPFNRVQSVNKFTGNAFKQGDRGAL